MNQFKPEMPSQKQSNEPILPKEQIDLEQKAPVVQHVKELMKKAWAKGLSMEALAFLQMAAERVIGFRPDKTKSERIMTLSDVLEGIVQKMNSADDIKAKLFEDRQQGKGNWGEEALRFVESFGQN